MPPPVTMPSNLIIEAVTAFKNLVNSIQGIVDPEQRLRQTTDSLGEVANVLDRLAASTAAHEQQYFQLDQRVGQTVQQVQNLQQGVQSALTTASEAKTATTSSPSSSANRKPLCESRSVVNLKTLGSKKEDFKNWNEKLVNATTQVFGLAWREFIGNLNERLDVDRKILSVDELGKITGANKVLEPLKCNEELYYLLVEKTEGDAALRVNSGTPGQGLQAYMRVYLWFAGTTGLALTEKTRMLMHPTPPKHEHEIADALEKWFEQERTLRAHGKNYELNVAFKVTALKILMSCRREHFENLEREAKARHGDQLSEAMFEDLANKIKEYAQQRRLEEVLRKTRGDPMDIGQLNQGMTENYVVMDSRRIR